MQSRSLQFEVHPASGVPIYRQIMDQARTLIAGGKLVSGDLLPSVRQMAAELQVNMMTVSKAYSRLEAEGVLERVRGKGMRVTATQVNGSLSSRKQRLGVETRHLVNRGRQLELTDKQILDVVNTVLKDRQR
jgi:GntR family transcriptional regulator